MNSCKSIPLRTLVDNVPYAFPVQWIIPGTCTMTSRVRYNCDSTKALLSEELLEYVSMDETRGLISGGCMCI